MDEISSLARASWHTASATKQAAAQAATEKLSKEFLSSSCAHASTLAVETFFAVGIVNVSFLLIREDIVCMADFFEFVAGSSIAYVLVGVVL